MNFSPFVTELSIIELSGDYLCPQRLLADRLRSVYLKNLLSLYRKGELRVSSSWEDEGAFLKWLGSLNDRQWIVSIQPSLRDLSQIVAYVGRYTKRACLSESKLESIADGQIRYRFNDYKNTPRGMKPTQGIITQDAFKFLDALLQHVPEKGYRMVRYYGLYSSRRYKQIKPSGEASCECACKPSEPDWYSEIDWGPYEDYRKAQLERTGVDPLYCLNCNQDYVFHCLIIDRRAKPKYEIGYENSS
ncbi:MAG: transposase [Bacteroidota bacterium]